MIRAPYNFVPLNKKIFFPDWAEQISHDVPFSDGESGTITIKLTAKSPIFVRNGSKNNDDISFSNYKGKYFIPGTSIKGMIRNVLEIMSFGKMQFVDDRKFSWRDLSNSNYKDKFTSGFNSPPLVKTGFIREIDGEWYLTLCKYARIEQCELDQEIGVSKLSALDKYNFWEKEKKEKIERKFNIGNRGAHVFVKQCGIFARASLGTRKEGQLVFTGQIDSRNNAGEGEHGKGKKHLEFVFYNESKNKQIRISEKMRWNFELNHSDDRNKEKHKGTFSPNEEWGYWKEKLSSGYKMPVFCLLNGENVHSFGLSMLYRLPLDFSVRDIINRTSEDHGALKEENFKEDLTDCIFGYIVNSLTLKGRVRFSHAKCINENPKIMNIRKEILASPKPTFYPNYLKKGDYSESISNLSGRKRYPVHKNILKPVYDSNISQKVFTEFTPLNSESEFICKIRFHNLKKIELGALLASITFAGHENEFFHSLGMSKPLGYGKVKVSLEKIISDSLSKENYQDYIDNFIKEMETYFNITWKSNKSIIELFTIATEQDNQIRTESELSYMKLKPDNEFVEAKKNKENLSFYSEIGNGVTPIIIQTMADLTNEFDNFLNNIKECSKKEVRKILKIICTFPKISPEQIGQISDILEDRKDFENQQYSSGSKNYIEIFEELKKKAEK